MTDSVLIQAIEKVCSELGAVMITLGQVRSELVARKLKTYGLPPGSASDSRESDPNCAGRRASFEGEEEE